MERLKILDAEHGVVMSHPGADRIPEAAESARLIGMRSQHYGWPGITRTLDGDILVSASERIQHVDPYGREVISRSTDGGRTWDEPQVIYNSITDDRDHAINTLPDGTVVSTWFTSMVWTREGIMRPEWEALAARFSPDTDWALTRGWLRRSHDGGRTWEDRVYPTIVGQHAGPSVLANGDMIYCGPYQGDTDRRLVATRSGDGGRTWSITGEIPCRLVREGGSDELRPLLNESHALEIEPEHILCVFRGSADNHNIHFTRTFDGGRTWSDPEDIGLYGYPSYLVRLQAGPIFCVFGDRQPPQAIRAILSHDDGATWDTQNVLTVREFPYRSDMGYPVALEVDPGEVLCAYYYVPRPSDEAHGKVDPGQAGILWSRIKLG